MIIEIKDVNQRQLEMFLFIIMKNLPEVNSDVLEYAFQQALYDAECDRRVSVNSDRTLWLSD